MTSSANYDNAFFKGISGGSGASARIILPILKPLMSVTSIVDVGCGCGDWLTASLDVFEMQADRAVGIDGEYARKVHSGLRNRFHYSDLSFPITLNEQFDLALSLEVAEHLGADRAEAFVDEICRLSKVVLFSAATPGQGGTGHINEQWPAYWQAHFARNSFDMYDCIRPAVWNNNAVSAWYAQNCFLYVRRDQWQLSEKLQSVRVGTNDWRLRLVHPGVFNMAACESAGARRLVSAVPGGIMRALRNRFSFPK